MTPHEFRPDDGGICWDCDLPADAHGRLSQMQEGERGVSDFEQEWDELKEAMRYEFIDRRGYLLFVGMWIGILVGGVAMWWNP